MREMAVRVIFLSITALLTHFMIALNAEEITIHIDDTVPMASIFKLGHLWVKSLMISGWKYPYGIDWCKVECSMSKT